MPVNGWARHPAVISVGRKGALLMKFHTAVFGNPKLIPAHASAAGRSIYRVHGDDRLAVAYPAVHQPRHDLVALGVQPPLGARLRHAVGELPSTQVMIRSHS